jgi:1-phosphofructokinase
MMRVLTVTFNPAIDQTVTLDRLTPGAVHRARSSRQDAGGKGVNVASCLADWDVAVSAFGLLGADNAAPFETLFSAKGIEDRFVRRAGATRMNLKLVDAAGTTDVNMDGAPVDAADIDAVVAALAAEAGPDCLFVLSGSLPPGCPVETYARIIDVVGARGATTLLDTSGVPLRLALDGKRLPDIVKPNRHELAEWLGKPVDRIADVQRAASDLHRRGVRQVVVSMGEQGALFLSDEGVLLGQLSAIGVASTVGAGDAMVAGIAAALAEGLNLEGIARLSIAFAVGKLSCPGPHLPARDVVQALAEQVDISRIVLPEAVPAGEPK